MGKHLQTQDVEKLKKQAADLSKVLADHAQALTEKAGELAREAGDWAEPHVDEVWKKYGPKVKGAQEYLSEKADTAWRESVKYAAPKIEAGSKAARPVINSAHDKVVDDYLPRLEHAMKAAAAAAASADGIGAKTGTAFAAAQEALVEPPKKSKAKKCFAWLAAGAAVAGAGYYLWKRTQPTEDPWAEEYWQNAEDGSPASKATAATHAVQDKAKEIAEKAGAYAKDLADAVKGLFRFWSAWGCDCVGVVRPGVGEPWVENGDVKSAISTPKAHHEIYLFFLSCGRRDLSYHRTWPDDRGRIHRRG